ncbi:MAG: hypothetical protein AB1782_16080 [Cyanobacteriota bacterium]
MKKFIGLLLITFIFCNAVLAANWETIFQYKNADGAAKIEVDRQSIKSKFIKGDKIVTFWARSELSNPKETVKALVLYEANCNNYDAYRLNTTLEFYKNNSLVNSIKNKQKEAVTGKDHTDLIPTLKDVCK